LRLGLAAVLGAAAALVAASMLGVAAAEAPTVTPARTVGVEGVAYVPISQTATAAEANAVYRQAMASAVSDGLSKAEVLAAKVGATLGGAQTVTEEGGEISCSSGNEYVEYEGQQADFGTARTATPIMAGGAAPAARTVAPRPLVKHRRRKRAKAAAAASCTLGANVSIAYAIG
jgi:hypothetical protein